MRNSSHLLYPRGVFCDLVEAFGRLVVRTKSEFCTPKITTKALDALDDATRFQIKRNSVAFRLVDSAADEHDGGNSVVVLFLFEGATETVHTGIVVEKEGTGVIGDGVPVGVDETGGVVSLARSFHTMVSIAGVKTNLTPCFRREVMGRMRFAISRRSFLQSETAPKRERSRFRYVGMGNFRHCFHFLRVRHDASRRDGVTKEIRIRGADGSR